MTNRRSRRNFIARTASGATGLLILSSARIARTYAANERLNLAVFGNMYNAEHFLNAFHIYNASLVAVCNPDQRKMALVRKRWGETAARLEGAKNANDRAAAAQYQKMANGSGVKIYSDVRRMFSEAGDSIDALVVSDYDHFHGVACGLAMRAGKPVCSERPLGMNISDARALRGLAAKTKVSTTYRSPGTATGQFRRAMELVEDGLIGPVNEVHFWFKRAGADRDSLPSGEAPIPDGLNWDHWLGPLPWRQYHPEWTSYSQWRETCNGGLGVFGMHTSIFPFLTLNLPELWSNSVKNSIIRVTAECSRVNRISFPAWERIRWELPKRGSMPPVTITWHHGPDFDPGGRQLLREKLTQFGISDPAEADALLKDAGSMLIGSDGALVGDDHSVRVTALPKGKFEKMELNRLQRISPSQGIYTDWIEACRGGKPHILADFENGGRLSELIMIGNVATLYPEETLTYDPALGKFTNKPEANDSLAFKYREGWQL